MRVITSSTWSLGVNQASLAGPSTAATTAAAAQSTSAPTAAPMVVAASAVSIAESTSIAQAHAEVVHAPVASVTAATAAANTDTVGTTITKSDKLDKTDKLEPHTGPSDADADELASNGGTGDSISWKSLQSPMGSLEFEDGGNFAAARSELEIKELARQFVSPLSAVLRLGRAG